MDESKTASNANLNNLEIPVEAWKDLGSNRPSWRSLVSSGASSAEQRRRTTAESKQAARKARAASSSTQSPSGRAKSAQSAAHSSVPLSDESATFASTQPTSQVYGHHHY